MSLIVSLEEIIGEERGLLSRHPSWPRVALGKVAEILNGFPFNSDRFNREIGFPIIRIRDLSAGTTETRYDGEVPEEFIVEDGDLLIGMDGIFRCVEWPGGKAGLNQRVCRITPNAEILNRRFLLYGLNGYLKAIEEVTSKVTVGHLSSKDILRIPFPMPPIAEQRRIVAKLEALLAKVDASRKRLERIPVILKRFRQAVIAAACDGRLTEDWRGSNPNIPSALGLLESIRSARKAQATKLRRSKNPDASISEIEVDGRPEDPVPSGWVWVRFGDVIGELRNGISTRPEMEPPGVPILRISAVRPGSVDLADIRFLVNGEGHLPISSLRDGDLLFTRYNGSLELLGVCGMVRGIAGKTVLYPDKLMRVRFDHQAISPAFAEIFFQVPKVHERITEQSKSSAGQNGVSGSDLKDQPFALPPVEEQQEIVRRVSELFVFADQIEARYAKAKTQVDRLTQSILAKAFRGELVPQDPNDEPAEVLLSRLGAAPTEESAPARRRGRPPRPQPAAQPVSPAARAEGREASALADPTPGAIIKAHREVLASIPSPLSEDNLLRAVALRLGFQRLGSRVKIKLQSVLLPEVPDERTPR